MLKFGTTINLDALDKMTTSKSIGALEAEIGSVETSNHAALARARAEITKLQSDMLEATRESTEALQAVADLRQRQAKLERSMSSGGAVGAFADDGPTARREAEERARLIQLVRLQAKVRARACPVVVCDFFGVCFRSCLALYHEACVRLTACAFSRRKWRP